MVSGIWLKATDYLEQVGGGLDHKPAATGGICLGENWGVVPGCTVTYLFELPESLGDPVLYLRYARGFDEQAALGLRLDGLEIPGAAKALRPVNTGGWGATESEWRWLSFPLPGPLSAGRHRLELESLLPKGQVNLDVLGISPAGSLPPDTPSLLGLLPHKPPVFFDEASGTVISSRFGSGVCFGGLGTGKFELMTDGSFGALTLNRNWDHPLEYLRGTFLAVRVGEAARLLRLAGPLEYSGVQNVRAIRYRGLAPRAELVFSDPGLPLDLRLEVFSPLVPQDEVNSSLPAAVFRFFLRNPTEVPLEVAIVFSWENVLGLGGAHPQENGEIGCVLWRSVDDNYQAAVDKPRFAGVACRTRQCRTGQSRNALGEYLVVAEKAPGLAVAAGEWNAAGDTVPFWAEFTATGRLPGIHGLQGRTGLIHPAALVSATCLLAPGEEREIRFHLIWRMPHHFTRKDGRDNGHYHLNYFHSITEVADHLVRHWSKLLAATREWQDLILRSNLPWWLRLKLINTVFTISANTVFTRDGRFAVAESPVTMKGALGTMDQRLASHAFYTMMYPELDRREIELFAGCQLEDGRITHFCGNLHEVVGDAGVIYGITDWPDLSCSFVMQAVKFWRWTGDREFLLRIWPHVERAMAWLAAADRDGDLVPEGGSTYDYEPPFGGMFNYTASCYLGALAAATVAARDLGKRREAEAYEERLAAVRESVVMHLWNGEFFDKWYNITTGKRNGNSFVAQLAGDWMARLTGLPGVLPAEQVDRALRSLIRRHLEAFPLIPPMEVDAAGRLTTHFCYILQHEPYFGMEAIYAGYPAEGLEVIRRVYHVSWLYNHSPWNQYLSYSAVDGRPTMLAHYMTATATWHVLNALTGATLDVPGETLYLGPRIPADWEGLECPVFFPRFWAWVSYDRRRDVVRLKVLKTFGVPLRFTHVATVTPAGGIKRLTLAEPFVAERGRVLRVEMARLEVDEG